MKKRHLLLWLILMSGTVFAGEPDILVTQSGESMKVYNLEMSLNTVFYTLAEDANAPVQKIAKKDVLIIKKADGSIIDLNKAVAAATELETAKSDNPTTHVPVTYTAIENSLMEEDIDWNKELKRARFNYFYNSYGGGKLENVHGKFILARNNDGQVLNMRIISDKDKTLAVARPRKVAKLDKKGNKEVDKKGNVKMKDGKYEMSEIIIPEYVIIDGENYSVTEIDPIAFTNHSNIKNVVFPETLRSIGAGAFFWCNTLNEIILPDALEKIGAGAFYESGDKIFKQLYIPKSVKEIGAFAFHCLGLNRSYRGFYQGTLTCIPDFVSEGNCKDFGIDEEAVRSYEQRKR